jgi:autotransporter-associated beta strand protein
MTRPLLPLGARLLPAFILMLSVQTSRAGSATWKPSPSSGDWNSATNWTPQTVPNGPSDVATFATSNTTAVSLSAQTEVDGITFNSGASPFTITVPPNNSGFSLLSITGVGVTNNSGATQEFVATADQAHTYRGEIGFFNSATAGSGTFTLNGGKVSFNHTSSAGSATFTLDRNAGPNASLIYRSEVDFFGGSADQATFIIKGATAADFSGTVVQFSPGTSAGSATFIVYPGSNGGWGGAVSLSNRSSGGTSRVELFGTAAGDRTDSLLAIGGNLTIGSIEGTGSVRLAGRRLTVGSNDLSTTFSGVIVDCPASNPTCGPGSYFGSLEKIGKGKLTLTGTNTYSGGTTIKTGKLLVNNTSGSGTGSGPVLVNGGQLSGNGTIAGAVTVGDGRRRGALLTPGSSATVTGELTAQGPVAFNSDATYKIQIDSSAATADKVLASGVTINTGAQFVLEDLGSGTLPHGTAFTVISNTAASPIAGTFINLPDNSTFTIGANTFKANYEGSDGNDLTLTVQ